MFARFTSWHGLAAGLVLGVAVGVLTLNCSSQPPNEEQAGGKQKDKDKDKKPPAGTFKEVTFLELNLVLLAPKEDKKTGFVVAGKNSTALIRGLKQLNGRPVAALEKDMRPGALSMAG